MSMQSFDVSPEELKVFFEEAEEVIGVLEDGLVRIEHEGGSSSIIHEVFRAAHTLKGSSATVGLTTMADLTHAMETVLDTCRHNGGAPERATMDALLESVDRLRVLLRTGIEDPGVANAIDTSDLVSRLGPPSADTVASPPVEQDRVNPVEPVGEGPTVRVVVQFEPGPWSGVRAMQALLALDAIASVVEVDPNRETLERGEPISIMQVRLRDVQDPAAVTTAVNALPEVIGIDVVADEPERRSDAAHRPAGETGPSTNRGATKNSSPLAHTVRVDVARLDSLMGLVGELVVARNRLAQLARQVESELPGATLSEGLAETTRHLERVTDQLQDEVMKSRLLAIQPIFQRLPRLVRDLASRLGKDVDLSLAGEETQLDRSVMEEISDPILHLVRNAVDHGIEPPDERVTLGKPSTGRLAVTADQHEGWVVVTIEDDGRGINLERVCEKAVAMGLLTSEQAAHLDDAEAARLIFAPGLSTATTISDVSGRGVGMDVVRANIERLNGTVTAETWPGRGTRFTLKLPLTLAITRGLLVEVGPTIYAIPLGNVGEAVRVKHQEVQALGHAEAIVLRGQTVPLLRLSRVFGLSATRDTADALVVTVRSGTRAMGLVVDRLLGTQELVVKPLAAMVRHVPAFAGATTLGDGRVALILDPGLFGREMATSS